MSDLRDRFGEPADELLRRFSSSLAIDLEMLDEEIDGSIAHATMLGECGILTTNEASELVRGLEQIRTEIRDGSWVPDPAENEDIHMAVEARLTEHCGALGAKLHTARSRNDQVATDVRLWMRKRIDGIDRALDRLLGVLLERIESDGKTLMPGFTHLQRGQPILLGHQLLAHTWPLARDRERFAQLRARVDRSPLGACAMAGTPHPIDRARSAELLGFDGVVENAMDAVAARDHLQETVAACAICTGHLSRMAEELVLWSSSEFAFVRLAPAWTTGSSIMPQKRNPDAAELVRGKAARVQGQLAALLGMTRALPLAYNRDLQEDRRPLFDALETTFDCVQVMAGMWQSLEVNGERYEDELRGDFSLATELADLMVTRGVPFREAHGVVGQIVRWCEEQGCDLGGLTREVAAGFHEALNVDLEPWLDPRQAAERRTSRGGTAWSEVQRQLALLAARRR